MFLYSNTGGAETPQNSPQWTNLKDTVILQIFRQPVNKFLNQWHQSFYLDESKNTGNISDFFLATLAIH